MQYVPIEVEVIPGLEQIAAQEIRAKFSECIEEMPVQQEGVLPMRHGGNLRNL